MMSTASESIVSLTDRLNGYQANEITIVNQSQAAVALIMRQKKEAIELLFIQRAESEMDPWSGQIAFPGGRLELTDSDIIETAIRETNEETGIVLDRSNLIGRLDDHQGRNRNRSINLVISCFVFLSDMDQKIQPNYEVAEAFWAPLDVLMATERRFDYQTDYASEPFPAIDLGKGENNQDRVLWGLTYRFFRRFEEITQVN